MNNEAPGMTPEGAQDALNAVQEMERAGWRRAALPQWVGLTYALLFAAFVIICGIIEKKVFTISGVSFSSIQAIGLAFLIFVMLPYARYTRAKFGAYRSDHKPPKGQGLAYLAVLAGLVVLLCVGIFIGITYDLIWLSVLVGIISGLYYYLLFEWVRLSYLELSREGEGQ